MYAKTNIREFFCLRKLMTENLQNQYTPESVHVKISTIKVIQCFFVFFTQSLFGYNPLIKTRHQHPSQQHHLKINYQICFYRFRVDRFGLVQLHPHHRSQNRPFLFFFV